MTRLIPAVMFPVCADSALADALLATAWLMAELRGLAPARDGSHTRRRSSAKDRRNGL